MLCDSGATGVIAGRHELQGLPRAFGVSGWSGAGRTPSSRNDPDRLKDNLLPYRLACHGHETEISNQLGLPLRFMPHVAPFFRGLSCTVNFHLCKPYSTKALMLLYSHWYANDKLVSVSTEPPEIRDVAHRYGCKIGGFAVDARNPNNFTVVAVLDNLLKGAATQAVQNINLMLALGEYEGLEE